MKWIAARGNLKPGQVREGGTGKFAWVKISLTRPLVLIRLVKDSGWKIRSQGDFYGNDSRCSEEAIGRLDLDRAGDAAGLRTVKDSQRGATGAAGPDEDV